MRCAPIDKIVNITDRPTRGVTITLLRENIIAYEFMSFIGYIILIRYYNNWLGVLKLLIKIGGQLCKLMYEVVEEFIHKRPDQLLRSKNYQRSTIML